MVFAYALKNIGLKKSCKCYAFIFSKEKAIHGFNLD